MTILPVPSRNSSSPQMKAIVFKEVGAIEFVNVTKPQIQHPTDAIVKLLHTSICGTDLHIMRGNVPTCLPGRILGHEGVGVIETLGSGVSNLQVGDCVLISCISACGTCKRCRAGMTSHCTTGGWILGHTIDGTQAEYVRVPHAGFSLYVLPPSVDVQSAVALSDAFPTAYECAILPGNLRPGCTIAVVGAGPVGLAVLVLAKKLFSPRNIVLIGKGDHRLNAGKNLGADHVLSSLLGNDPIIEQAMAANDGEGFDVVVECVGIPETFDLCQRLLGLGGILTNVGVHGTKVDLHLQDLWAKNICITSRLVDTTTLGDLVSLVQKERIDPALLISHRFKFSDITNAYETFKAGSSSDVLKVVISMD
ncbi:alcohol dehydrogenase [Aspergillus ambiguus]|uniref:zinc-dependent alcohol dehydrogenase family protein n=1 Tax=Aspergillus ambiguus TaxID=176160 RepID=UPI003CCD91C8